MASGVRGRRFLTEREYADIEWLRTNPNAVESPAFDQSVRYAYLADLRRARQDMLPLVDSPAVRARVNLNLGSIALSFGQRDEARRYFENVQTSTTNRCLAYLGLLLRGYVDDLDSRPTEAEPWYRKALALVPGAQSATSALASVLWMTDRGAEAVALLDATLAQSSIADDPWTAWQNAGQCTELPAFILRLREGLKR
jgi:predicted Zn-dependent protease